MSGPLTTADATVTVSVLASYGAQPADGCRPATSYDEKLSDKP